MNNEKDVFELTPEEKKLVGEFPSIKEVLNFAAILAIVVVILSISAIIFLYG